MSAQPPHSAPSGVPAQYPHYPQYPEAFYPPEPDGDFNISLWFDIIRRRRWLLVVVCALSLVVAAILYAITPRLYRATAVVQIERRVPSVVGIDEQLLSESWYDAETFYPTQYRLLQSRGLAERAVRTLRLVDDPLFNPARASLVGGSATASTAADDEAAAAALAGQVLGGLQVTPVRNTRLVEIAYTSTNPVLAAYIANGVAETYIDWSAESRSQSVGRASSFLAAQIETIKQEIQDKEAQLGAYSSRTDIFDLDPASNTTLSRLEALNRDYTQAVSDRINKETRYQELLDTPAETAADQVSGGAIAQQRAELMRLERDYASKLATYKPDWPAMQDLKAQIDKARSSLNTATQETMRKARDNARVEYQGARRREQTIEDELVRQRADLVKFNSAAVEYNNLKVEVSTRRQLFDTLVKKQSETEVASRLQGTGASNVMMVDRALVPGGPFRPSLRRNLMLGLMIGVGLGLGLVFLLEYLDRTLKTAEDVERVLKMPLLAVVPDLANRTNSRRGAYYGYYYGKSSKKKQAKLLADLKEATRRGEVKVELVPHTRPRLAVSEAYRSLRTSLMLSSAEGLHSVVVTSAIPGEGKTSTAANLAVVLAQLGRDVLLVDGDLRKPRLHEVFSVSNRTGLVNYLTGNPPEGLFGRTTVPNLFVTVAGPIPPNPAELLASDRMREFLALAKQHFAFLVIDSPPTLPVTDAAVLGSMVDGVVLCVGAGVVLREDARACRERLRMTEAKVLGAALNYYREPRQKYSGAYRHYEAYVASSANGAS